MWGASNSNRSFTSTSNRSLGGYCEGKVFLNKGQIFYIYVGASNQSFNLVRNVKGLNGGVGGSTDIRLISGEWDDVNSLRSRIMVAGGAGGTGWTNSLQSPKPTPFGGSAGGLTGQSGSTSYNGSSTGGAGATQTTGNGFGFSVYTTNGSVDFITGGNGYYSGFNSSTDSGVGGAGGGSSFISGHTGCNAVNSSGSHTSQPIHYSGLCFYDTIMINGNSDIAIPFTENEYTYFGNGYVTIEPVKDFLNYSLVSHTENNLNFSITTKHLTTLINKVEVYINDNLYKSYSSGFNNINVVFDDNPFIAGLNIIKIKVIVDADNYVVYEVYHNNNIIDLSSNSTLSETLNRSCLLLDTNNIHKKILANEMKKRKVDLLENATYLDMISKFDSISKTILDNKVLLYTTSAIGIMSDVYCVVHNIKCCFNSNILITFDLQSASSSYPILLSIKHKRNGNILFSTDELNSNSNSKLSFNVNDIISGDEIVFEAKIQNFYDSKVSTGYIKNLKITGGV